MSKIETQVMASVAAIHAARRLTGRTALELYALGVSLAGVATLVSIPNIAANFSNVAQLGLSAIATFLVAAITNTTLFVQLALVVGAFALVFLCADLVRALHQQRSFV